MTCHSFYVGKIRCVVVPDGRSRISPAEIAAVFPPQFREEIMELQPAPEFDLNCLLVESDGQLILFDTGKGTLDPDHSAQLLAHLHEAGAVPEDIDIVVLTHGHGDHMGGVVDDAGQLTFPKARHLMTRLDWDHWTGPALRPSSERCLFPLRDPITLIQPDDLIAPGVRALPALGHTPGHIGVMIESQGARLMHVVDTLHHSFQVTHPGWSPLFDTDPVASARTRRALLDQAATERCRLMVYHFGFPGLGTVSVEGDGFVFSPEG